MPIGSLGHVLVDSCPNSQRRFQAASFRNRLVGTVRIHLECRPAVQPSIGPAQTEALRCDNADMVGRITLAQNATVEAVHIFVFHPGHPLIALAIGHASLPQRFLHSFLIGKDRDLHFVHNAGELILVFVNQQLAKCFNRNPFW